MSVKLPFSHNMSPVTNTKKLYFQHFSRLSAIFYADKQNNSFRGLLRRLSKQQDAFTPFNGTRLTSHLGGPSSRYYLGLRCLTLKIKWVPYVQRSRTPFSFFKVSQSVRQIIMYDIFWHAPYASVDLRGGQGGQGGQGRQRIQEGNKGWGVPPLIFGERVGGPL
jgi:hypothetical protein